MASEDERQRKEGRKGVGNQKMKNPGFPLRTGTVVRKTRLSLYYKVEAGREKRDSIMQIKALVHFSPGMAEPRNILLPD